MRGAIAAGSPFNVYLQNTKEGRRTERDWQAAIYAVKPRDRLTRQYPLSMFADSGYSVAVHGPNGFFRSFTRRADSSHVDVRASCEQSGSHLTGNLQLHLQNISGKPVIVEIKDNSYNIKTVTRGIDSGQEMDIVLPLERSHGWYDFTVKATGSDVEARFAGRVETGRPTYTGPLMGGIFG